MKKYWIGISFGVISFMLIAYIFFITIQKSELEKSLTQYELEANSLREEVLRLQKIAVDAKATAQTAEIKAIQAKNEAVGLLEELEKCRQQ